jgi:hypothetical protein
MWLCGAVSRSGPPRLQSSSTPPFRVPVQRGLPRLANGWVPCCRHRRSTLFLVPTMNTSSPSSDASVGDEPTKRLAVLIDADNAQPAVIEALLEEVARFGEATVRRIYGDFTSPASASWKKFLNKHSIKPIQQFAYTIGKNATDGTMIIDAMDLLYTRPQLVRGRPGRNPKRRVRPCRCQRKEVPHFTAGKELRERVESSK